MRARLRLGIKSAMDNETIIRLVMEPMAGASPMGRDQWLLLYRKYVEGGLPSRLSVEQAFSHFMREITDRGFVSEAKDKLVITEKGRDWLVRVSTQHST
jgi:hypothetical protein